MTRKALKRELHHWWPRSLFEYWRGAHGMISMMRPTGTIILGQSTTFGAIANAHQIKIGAPWDSTFEPLFGQADSEIIDFVRWLTTLGTSIAGDEKPIIERITRQPLCRERQQQLARITASLLARSPRVRHSIKLTTEYYRRQIGFADPTADETLIAANQRGLYEAFREQMASRGLWAILFSDEKEFIAGDGFLHNFPASPDGLHAGLKLVLPILPTATLIYALPLRSSTQPRLMTLRASAAEVRTLNAIVQVYASQFIFFREEEPVISEDFICGEHMRFEHHKHDWLDTLIDAFSRHN